MKYVILAIAILFLSGCDFKAVDEGKTPPKEAMKCGAGKCGAKMINPGLKDTNKSKEQKVAPKSTMKCGGDMKCAAGKCGNAPKKAPAMKCGEGKCG